MILYGANKNPIDADIHGNVKTRSIVRSELNDASFQKKAYSWTSAYTTGGADEEVIYIKNTDTSDYLEIHQVILGTAATAVFTISQVTGTAGGASAITSAPLNLSSTTSPNVSATGGASVTGLTIGNTLAKIRVIANYSDMFDFQGSILIPPGGAIAVTNSATGACEVTIIGHFDSLES